MHLRHSEQIWREFPDLVPGVLLIEGVTAGDDVHAAVEEHLAVARSPAHRNTEAQLPEVQAWRRAFAAMALKPAARPSRCCGACARTAPCPASTHWSICATPSRSPTPSRSRRSTWTGSPATCRSATPPATRPT